MIDGLIMVSGRLIVTGTFDTISIRNVVIGQSDTSTVFASGWAHRLHRRDRVRFAGDVYRRTATPSDWRIAVARKVVLPRDQYKSKRTTRRMMQ